MVRKTTTVARRSRLRHTSRSNGRPQAAERAAPLLLPREARHPRRAATIGEVNQERIARAVREIIIAIGENPDREGLRNTPSRIARAYAELTAGLRLDPRSASTIFCPSWGALT
jgi:GTP cyclohydrolase I